MKSAGVVLAPKDLNKGKHVRGSMEADWDKSADVEASSPLVRRSIREKQRSIRLAGYHTPGGLAIGKAMIGCED